MKHILLLVSITLITGCSTMINGTSQKLTVIPQNGQSIAVDVIHGDKKYSTSIPTEITLYPGDIQGSIQVITKGDCVSPQSIVVRKELADAYWLNLFNLFGFIVDEATGAMWQYPEKATIQVNLSHDCLSKLAAPN
jgi:hypothetical protein